ncbi:MAG: magnesium and cobalt transport protein CorA [Dokdonella sp.]
MNDSTLSANSGRYASMIVNCVVYTDTGVRVGDIPIDDISEVLKQPDRFVWIGLLEPDAALLEKLQEEFDLHDLAIEDAQNAHQRPKIDVYNDSLFVVAQTVQVVNAKVEFGETHIFLGPRYLITVRHGASVSYAPARRSCEQSPELLALGPSYGLYAILDLIVDNFVPIVRSFREDLQELEEDIFEDTFKRETIKRLYDLKKELVTLRLAIGPLQDTLGQLTHLFPRLIRDEVRPYFRDVFDHATRINESADTMREMLTAALTVNLSLVTVTQGEVVKRLAGWAALLAAPTLLASWYGMNFAAMPELNMPWAYPTIIGITAMVCTTLFIVLRRAKWL